MKLPKQIKDNSLSLELAKNRQERNSQFLELYKQKLKYRDIANKFGISEQHVKRIIRQDVAFQSYISDQKKRKAADSEKKRQQKKEDLLTRNLAILYPEKVRELWDYEKNGTLNPENVLAKTTVISIWLKCPIDGHSWQKTPSAITRCWVENGRSGCPICAGKTKKCKRQLSLIEVYPELIDLYWDYEKNDRLNLDPCVLTLCSNKKAWLKCPIDGHEWKKTIAQTINQQWSSRNNSGCHVCNGTDNNSRKPWKHQDSIVAQYPDEIAKYWHYEANDRLNLDPTTLTTGSRRKAWFKCPIDGHEWLAGISPIVQSWKRGHTGCPACKGFVITDKDPLIILYPKFIERYWDYTKNNKLEIYPTKVTKGSHKKAWFKCPIGNSSWEATIINICRTWRRGHSGCDCCPRMIVKDSK